MIYCNWCVSLNIAKSVALKLNIVSAIHVGTYTQCAAVTTQRLCTSVAPHNIMSQSNIIRDPIHGHECGLAESPPTIFDPGLPPNAPVSFGLIGGDPQLIARARTQYNADQRGNRV